MSPRELYTSAGTVACATFALAGLAMPLSDLVRLTQYGDAAGQLEAAGAACMVVGILAVCFWFCALRRLKSGDPLLVPDHYRIVVVVLVCFGLAVSTATAVFPSTKLTLELVLHCSPLVMCYLIWSMWKANGAGAM